ncbi:MAG TPA: hypothetical protein VNT53_00665 [Pseudolysinimonas sp.]|nr:hypothetical protein [Pseudolysinimonas sp.]
MQYLILLGLPFLLAGGLITLLWQGAWWLVDWVRSRRERRRVAIERELDRKQAQLRATILQLAEELGNDAHEARKALIRESFLASRVDLDQP